MKQFFWSVLFLALAGCERFASGPGVKVDPALAALVPPETVLMVDTQVESLLKTPVYQKYLANVQVAPIEEFARQTGIDPRRDLKELLFVSSGSRGVLLGRGRFSSEEQARVEKQPGAIRTVYKGFNLIGNERAAVMFFNSSTVVAGDIGALHSLIDQRGNSHGPPAPLAALMKEIPADAQLWAAYTGGSVDLALEGNLANVTKLLSSIESGTIYVDLRAGLKSVAEGNCSNAQSAQQVHDALKALVGFGRLSVRPDQQDLLPIYDSIQVTQDKNRVTVQVDIPQDLVEKFLNAWMGRKS